MTKEETIKILATLAAFYGAGKANAEQMATAWYMVLADYDYSEAMMAVLAFVKRDTRDYATLPAPGKIIAIIEEEHQRRAGLVEDIYRKIAYGRPYDDLSTDCKQIIGLEMYNDWVALDPEYFAAHGGKFKKILAERLPLLAAQIDIEKEG